mmetsp:Transcript_26338/g.61432  ORF Transcript_26338/g.61432 Transcript_26338/m.61432 type:complete len:254 (-) Transcript_26338:78-839(-)
MTMKLSHWHPCAYASEFIGTFFLVFTVSLNTLQRTAFAPISIGSIYMVMVSATALVSGGHFNPAVTLGVALGNGRRQINVRDTCVYVLVQLFAGLVAGCACWCVFHTTFPLRPAPGHSIAHVLVVEAVFTAALVFVFLTMGPRHCRDSSQLCLPMAIGFMVMAAAFAIGDISGYSLNPAVAFGVFVANWMHGGEIGHLLLYFFSPLGGALLGVGLFLATWVAEFGLQGPERVHLLARSVQSPGPSSPSSPLRY